jgi:tetratricopeptide (TPR) repeat protein
MATEDALKDAIKAYIADSGNARMSYGLNTAFWGFLCENISTLVREKGDIKSFVNQHADLINYGLHKELRPDSDAIADTHQTNGTQYRHIKVARFSDWLLEEIAEILEGNRKEILSRDIRAAEMQIKHVRQEVEAVQESRKQFIIQELSANGGPDATTALQIERLAEIDALYFESLKTKRTIARGVFYSVTERRAFVERESRLQKEQAKAAGVASQVQSQPAKKELHGLGSRITELFTRIIDLEETIARIDLQIQEIETRQESMSPLEMENRISRSLEYVRELVKLSAKRLRFEPCSLLRPKDVTFTYADVCTCLDRILEFDPKFLNNDRVSFLGKPSVLMVPGNGNALYDWKNNRFIIPLIAPGGNFAASIATAIIEYRFDVDDEKAMLTSYTKIPENKGIRSLFQLKGKLTKDYICWITSEYKGFRVLSKDTKKWFEHEIAPSRNDIYCPPEFQPFNLTAKEFKDMYERTESRVSTPDTCDLEDLWAASILFNQQGQNERAFTCIKSFCERNGAHRFARYNLGHIAMRNSRKQDAITAFNEFIQADPQSWWASVARDNVRRLQME